MPHHSLPRAPAQPAQPGKPSLVVYAILSQPAWCAKKAAAQAASGYPTGKGVNSESLDVECDAINVGDTAIALARLGASGGRGGRVPAQAASPRAVNSLFSAPATR